MATQFIGDDSASESEDSEEEEEEEDDDEEDDDEEDEDEDEDEEDEEEEEGVFLFRFSDSVALLLIPSSSLSSFLWRSFAKAVHLLMSDMRTHNSRGSDTRRCDAKCSIN